MKGFSKTIVKLKVPILILALVLAIPSAVSYLHTKVNYDLLTYLPEDIETMVGQNILKEELGTGGFSALICEGMPEKDVKALKEQISELDGVKDVIWYDSVLDISVPMEILPDEIYEEVEVPDPELIPPPVKAVNPTLPSVGDTNILMFVVDFPDCVRSDHYTAEQILERTFGPENRKSSAFPLESISAFYERASYSRLHMHGDVFLYNARHNNRIYY